MSLKGVALGCRNFAKGKEIIDKQNEYYNKWLFVKNLKKAMEKEGEI